jgi:hypothetical protein
VDHQLIDPSQTTWEKSRNIIRSQQVRDRLSSRAFADNQEAFITIYDIPVKLGEQLLLFLDVFCCLIYRLEIGSKDDLAHGFYEKMVLLVIHNSSHSSHHFQYRNTGFLSSP